MTAQEREDARTLAGLDWRLPCDSCPEGDDAEHIVTSQCRACMFSTVLFACGPCWDAFRVRFAGRVLGCAVCGHRAHAREFISARPLRPCPKHERKDR